VCVGAKRRLARSREELRKLGFPERSVRSTIVLAKKPMSPSSSVLARWRSESPRGCRPDGEPREQDVERGEERHERRDASWRASVRFGRRATEAAPPNDMIRIRLDRGAGRSVGSCKTGRIRTNEHASTEGAPRDAPRRGPDAATT